MPSNGLTVATVFNSLPAGNVQASLLDGDFSQLFTAYNSLLSPANYFSDSSGAANVIAVTVPAPLMVAYAAGLPLQIQVANTNTGATTINVNGLGATALVYANGAGALQASQIQAGAIVSVMFDGTNFQLLGVPGAGAGVTGTFPGTLSGMSATVSGTFTYVISNGVVTLEINGNTEILGQSNANSMTLSGLPASCFNSTSQHTVPCVCFDNGVIKLASATIGVTGIVTFNLAAISGSFVQMQAANNFTPSGFKGLNGDFSITYAVI